MSDCVLVETQSSIKISLNLLFIRIDNQFSDHFSVVQNKFKSTDGLIIQSNGYKFKYFYIFIGLTEP